jgi:hypothetical protein
MILQVIAGIFCASFLEWTVHKYLLHGKRNKKPLIKFHWSGHHATARRNAFQDAVVSLRESIGILLLCILFAPMILFFPFVYYTMFFHAILYLFLHNVSHRYPSFGKRFMPWHYDHHMGVNQNLNWCVVHPLADYILGTRKKYEY